MKDQQISNISNFKRLLKRVSHGIKDKSEWSKSEWWSTEIDTLLDIVEPLWLEIGIKEPAIRCLVLHEPTPEQVSAFKNKEMPSNCWQRVLLLSGPDSDVQQSVILAYGDTEARFNILASDMMDILDTVDEWIAWAEAKLSD